MRRVIEVALVVSSLLAGGSAHATEKRFGDWTVGVISGDAGLYAATENDSGGMLGKYCYAEQAACLWLLVTDIKCDDGSRYPVLVNTDQGAASTDIVCKLFKGLPRYMFANFDEIDTLVNGATRVGIAFPMKNGLFQVSRFSMVGSARAVAFMTKTMEDVVEKANANSTEDQTY
jgi:hypothetical protein